jgi:hypothetical protein
MNKEQLENFFKSRLDAVVVLDELCVTFRPDDHADDAVRLAGHAQPLAPWSMSAHVCLITG